MQFVSTVSSFLHTCIMIRHTVDFCKNEPRFMSLIIFHSNCILLLMMKMNKKQFLFHSWKIRAEGQIPLIKTWNVTDFLIMFKMNGTSTCTFFSSPELKAQMSFPDHLQSLCLSVNFSHFHLKFFSRTTEPFSTKLAQSIFGWRGCKCVQTKVHALFQEDIVTK